MSNSPTNIIEAVADKRLIGDVVSTAQATALKALYGEPLTDAELAIYRQATERDVYVPRETSEAMFCVGRRGGKSSKLAANIAVYEAVFRQHRLAPGERGHIVVIACTKKQAAVCFDYILARLEGSPTLRKLIEGEPRADEVDLTNGITIAVWPCNFRTVRGISIVCAICDEIAFWRDDITGANPAGEVLRALRPAMATFPTAKLIKISSPYAKTPGNVVWDDWQARHKRNDLLVWRLDSQTMNPSLDPKFIASEFERDPEFASREYGRPGEPPAFWESASMFLPSDAIDACVVPGRYEVLPQSGLLFTAAMDAAFRGDLFGFCLVGKNDQGKIVQALMRSWRGSRGRPVNMAATLAEIVSTLRHYGVTEIFGDQFCAEPIRQALRAEGIQFEQRTTLGSRAQCFNTLRTLITSGGIELLEDPETIAELKRLELAVTSGGNQRIEATSGHDDRAVALALAAHEAVATELITPWVSYVGMSSVDRDADDGPGWIKCGN